MGDRKKWDEGEICEVVNVAYKSGMQNTSAHLSRCNIRKVEREERYRISALSNSQSDSSRPSLLTVERGDFQIVRPDLVEVMTPRLDWS